MKNKKWIVIGAVASVVVGGLSGVIGYKSGIRYFAHWFNDYAEEHLDQTFEEFYHENNVGDY